MGELILTYYDNVASTKNVLGKDELEKEKNQMVDW